MNSIPIVRPVRSFSPSLWGNKFLDYKFDDQLAERYFKAIKELEVEMKTKMAAESKLVDTMILIDTLERLGISYHFENEIKGKLEHFFDLNTNYEDDSYDLYTVSLHFRLFRKHGYRITSGIFIKFHDCNGKFHEAHKNDGRGLLSFFEAVQLRTCGEKILEDALVFAKDNLRCMAPNLTSPLKKQVENALEQQLHLGFPRLESLKFVSIYEEDEFRDKSLLKFAKLDYNALQMRHRQELSELSRWWKELDLIAKFPYARDRLVEAFFVAVAAYSEPMYSRARATFTKAAMFLLLVDDTFDNYGTVEELQIFTRAIERWDMSQIDGLPEYMKPLYWHLLKFFEQLDHEELAEVDRSYALDYAIEEFKEMARGFYVEAKWFIEGHLPSFSTYQSNALTTSGCYFLATSFLLGVKSTTRKDFELLKKKPRMVVAGAKIMRFLDDVASYQNEKERGQLASGVECYMKENGVTKEEAMNKFLEIASRAWMEMNEDCLNPSPYSKDVKNAILGIVHGAEIAYKNHEDGFTKPEKVWKHLITSLLVDPFNI